MLGDQTLFLRLSAISAAIADGLPRQAVFARVVEAVQKLGFERARLDLISEDGAWVEPAVAHGFGDQDLGEPVPVAEDADLAALAAECRPQILKSPETAEEHGCVPVIWRSGVVGKIRVDNARSRRPLETEPLEVALHFAHQVALAQEMLPGDAKLWAESLETLGKTTLAIFSARGRDALLRNILEESVKLLKARSGGIYEYRPEREELELIADYNRPDNVGKTLKRNEGLAGTLIGNRKTHAAVEDYDNWSGRAAIYAGKGFFGSVLEVPLRSGGNDLGVLFVDDVAGRHFSKTDIRLLRLFAEQATIALVNSTLLNQDERKLKRLEQLALATREIMSDLGTIPLRVRLDMIANHAAAILDAETSGVFLADGDELVLEAGHGEREAFSPGKVPRLKVHDEPGGGLTGYIAHQGKPFKAHGEMLKKLPWVAHSAPHAPSGNCYSLLAIPLRKRVEGKETLVGLLRVDNKKGDNARALDTLGFSEEDESILAIFAEAVLVAIESAELVSQLTEQGAFRQRLISSSPDGIIAVNREGRVREFNKRAEEILGYTREEALNQPVAKFYWDSKEPRRIGRLLHENPDHHVRNYETFVRSKAGEKIPILHASTWLQDADGQRDGSVGYFEDLRLQKELKRRESLLLKASTVLGQAADLDHGLQRLVAMIVSELGHSFCGILLMDEDERALTLRAECVAGRPEWRSRHQRIVLAEWKGLPELLRNGKPWIRRWDRPQGRPVLERLTEVLGFDQEIGALLVVPLKAGDRVVGQLDLGDLWREGQPAFSKEEIELVSALASQITGVIQRFQFLETMVRRESLLKALVQASPHIQPDPDLPALQQVIVRLAAEMVDCRVGGLFLNRSYLHQLELVAVHNLPKDLIGERRLHEDGLLGKVAREGEAAVHPAPQEDPLFRRLDLRFAAVVPFRRGSGEVEAVLFIGDPEERRTFGRNDLEILEAFANQATIALDTAGLMDREQLYGRQLATLYRISDYLQRADTLYKILHSVLTGITAHYGLRFNRAILMLVDETGENLIGKMGIGELEDDEARAAWKPATGDDFERYLRRLENGEIELTTVGKRVADLRLPIRGSRVLSEVVENGQYQQVPTEELHRIPERFVRLFRVRTAVMVAPLTAKGQVIGVLVVDNKFTQMPIGDDLSNALMTFASTAAVAIENRRLFDQTRSSAEKLMAFYQMSSELIALREPREILKKIVEQTVTAAGASWVSIVLIDKAGRALNPIESGDHFSLEPQDALLIRPEPEGLSMRVMRTGEAFAIESVAKMRDIVNPVLMRRSVEAAICLPLSLAGKRIGVMWIHYDKPHRFPKSEVASLQLYVNQAAIAYDSSRRIETLEDIRGTFTALAEIGDVHSMLERIVHRAQRVLKANEAVLWLYDQPTDHFIPEVSTYAGDHLEAWRDLQEKGPQQRGTAFRIMDRNMVYAEDIQDPSQSEDVGPTTRHFLETISARGFHGVALKVGREKLGVLYAIYNRPCQFDEEERETALTFANHAALALKKAKLLDQVQRAREAAEMVARVTLMEDPKHALLTIAQEIREALGCGAVVLFRYDEETGDLIWPTTVTGVHPQEDAKVGRSLVLAMVERDGPYIVTDVTLDPYFKDSQFAQTQGIKSCVVIPLKAAGRKVGVMFVNYRSPRRFTADEVTNMELFANQAAVAIRNEQLFEESAAKLAQQETLAELSREFLLAKTVQETLKQAVRFAARALDTEFSNIVLPNREEQLIFSEAVGWRQDMVDNYILERGEGSQTGYTIQRREPVAVFDYHKEKRFRVPEVVFEHQIRSGLSAPMFRGEEIVGAILVHTTKLFRFNEDHGIILSLIANQTAIALERAQQYEAIQRKSSYLTALYEASTAITAKFGLERRQVLEQIIQPAMDGIVGIQGPKAILGTIQLYDEARDELFLDSVYPPDRYPELEGRIGERRPLRSKILKGKRIGVTGRTVLDAKPQLVPDVSKDEEYIEFAAATLSELAVPLFDREGKVIGVLNVESDHLNAFDEEDKSALQTLAGLAVIGIQNARQVEALRTQTTLAWMGLGNAVGRHELAGQMGILLSKLHLLEESLFGKSPSPARAEELLNDLESRLRGFSLDRPQGQANEEVCSIRVNDELIDPFRERFLESHPGWRQRFTTRCELDPAACIRVNLDWLFRVLDILVNNAAQAKAKNILLGSRSNREDWVQILVSDDGEGIPSVVRERLLREPIREGSKGLGTGLLIAQEVVRSYGGRINYEDRKPRGTAMVISLPKEMFPEAESIVQ